jgi:hypothetical protein
MSLRFKRKHRETILCSIRTLSGRSTSEHIVLDVVDNPVEKGLLSWGEAAVDNLLESGVYVLGNRVHTRLDHRLERTPAAKDAPRDDAEGYRLEVVLLGPQHRLLVRARIEKGQIIIVVGAKTDARPHGVNDFIARELARDRNLGVAGVAALAKERVVEERQPQARLIKLFAAPVVDLCVDATSAEAALVGRVDNGVSRKPDHAVVRNVERGGV